jgi:hypothetical protein
MKKTKLPYYEIFTLILGEIIVSLITAAVYLFTDNFDYKVITGVTLGTLVTVLNFLYLSVTTTKAINNFMALRNEKGEMTEEESAAFVAEHQAKIQNSIKLSYIIRTFTMLVALVVALLTKQFALIATVIPLVAFRPITMAAALIKRKVVKE